MGSAVDEPGRWDSEDPQHAVTIAEGFWLFDTPCTQALWEAVMSENPSRFQTPDCPVEGVSWHQVQDFLERIRPGGGRRRTGLGKRVALTWIWEPPTEGADHEIRVTVVSELTGTRLALLHQRFPAMHIRERCA